MMNAPDDYCELCELAKSQCVHGRPPPPPVARKTVAAPRPAKRPSARKRPAAAPAKAVIRRWTPPEVFKPHIITVLEQAGGELEADDVFVELQGLVEDRLLPKDTETTPEGELRWRYAARRARVALIDEGVMTKSRPGIWQLAPRHQHLG
jgi:hypothetical protein